MIRRTTRRRMLGERRGNAMLEFALAFVVMVPLFLGAYEFGYAFYIYNSLQSAVRGGARYASLRTYDSATNTPSDAYSLAVRNTVVYGDPTGAGEPVVPNFSTDDVSVDVIFENGRPWDVEVSLPGYETNAAVSLVQIRQKPHLKLPYTGRWDPTF